MKILVAQNPNFRKHALGHKRRQQPVLEDVLSSPAHALSRLLILAIRGRGR